MEFDTAQAVWEVAQELLDNDRFRSANRALINRLFNGEPPLTQEQADMDRVDTNVNFKQAPAAGHEVQRQYYNGFLRGETYFSVRLDGAPAHKSWGWGHSITTNINRCMKKSNAYRETLKGQFCQTGIHGIGPVFWPGPYTWQPLGVGLDDFLVPPRVRTSFDNLSKFCIVRRYTAAELWRLTHGPGTDDGWNMDQVNKLLAWLAKEKIGTNPIDWDITPEKLAEIYQTDRGFFNCDLTPTALVYDFYYQEPERDYDWYRCMVLASINSNAPPIPREFLYKKSTPVSDTWEKLIHVQFGNGACTAPFLYHAVRGMGFLTFDLFHLNNRMRSRFSDHVFQQLIELFRINTPADQDRLQNVDLVNKGTIPEGLGFVTAAERFTVNHQLIQLFLEQNERTLAQNSASFTQDLVNQRDTPMTAYETAARIQASNAMISGMLADAYEFADRQYAEICRRFTLKQNPDPDVKKFKEYCKRDGVPDEWIDSQRWIVRAERKVGDGNKILEMAQTNALMEGLMHFSPEAQRQVVHLWVQSLTDPATAKFLAPTDRQPTPSIVFEAQQDAAVLMQNLPLAFREDINHINYTEAMLASMTMIVQTIEQGQEGMATPQQVAGLMGMTQHVTAHIQLISQNKNEKQRVSQYNDVLRQLTNLIKAYAQRLQEQQEAQGDGQMSAETRTAMIEQLILAQSKARIDEARAMQKMQLKQAQFMSELERRNIEKSLDLRDKALETRANIAALDAKTAAEIRRDRFKPTGNGE